MRETFSVTSHRRRECVDITPQIVGIVERAGIREGLCHVMALHATAGIIVNENADPEIGNDLLEALEGMVPDDHRWRHDRIDDNAEAHIKASILGPSETLQIHDGRVLFGTWQNVMLVELDGPRASRTVSVTILPG